MFTGVVQAVGAVRAAAVAPRHTPVGMAHTLDVDLGRLADGLALGGSVAVNGVCLTLTALHGTVGSFDVVPETWRRTTLRRLTAGDAVNLERSLRAGDPLDGHFVQGHVEGVGRVERVETGQGEWKLWVRVDRALLPAITPKGSVALEGTSLTVVDVVPPQFSVALIPTTLTHTVLGKRSAGDEVNVETDILARLVNQRIGAFLSGADPAELGVSQERLREAGFAS